ncbi:hypothetical protein CDA63_11865 [Hymenobacter amundsenii]|uniref:Uncharacterized protein n=2 Tax=Hymenobacter amundsenii TaxID=2006685 RepID=A0A246FK39_9BACT|nr:hypothetical protein CDA63_11865 [Hymenobacter amundsenii]
MFPQPLSLRKARRHWHDFYNFLLSKSETKQLTRLIKRGTRAGTQQVVYVPQKPFSASCKDTGALLIKRALDAVHQLRQVQFLQEGHEGGLSEGVVIEVNCVELGKKRSLSDRTMRTHIAQLMDAGLIIAKYFHGWRRNLELVISKKYLFEMVQNTQKGGLNNGGSGICQPVCVSDYGTKLPPIQAPNRLINTTLTNQVEKWKTPENQEKEISARAGGADAAGDEAAPKMGKQGAGGRLKALLGPKAPAKIIRQQSAVEAQKARMLALFSEELFTKACRMLYPRKRFTAEQYQLSLDAIAAGVYRHLDTTHLTLPQWQQYHAGCLERVRLAGKWFARHTDAEVSWPYALYTNGLGYFDAHNPNGFIRTEQWLAENEVKQRYRRITTALQAAETEFSQFKQLQRGLKISATKRVKEFTAWELYRWHENRIRLLGRESALKRFYEMAGQSLATKAATS